MSSYSTGRSAFENGIVEARRGKLLAKLLPRARSITFERSGHRFGVVARADLLEILRDAAR